MSSILWENIILKVPFVHLVPFMDIKFNLSEYLDPVRHFLQSRTKWTVFM